MFIYSIAKQHTGILMSCIACVKLEINGTHLWPSLVWKRTLQYIMSYVTPDLETIISRLFLANKIFETFKHYVFM